MYFFRDYIEIFVKSALTMKLTTTFVLKKGKENERFSFPFFAHEIHWHSYPLSGKITTWNEVFIPIRGRFVTPKKLN